VSIWAIIPVKPLRRGKSRLAGVLTEDERAKLNSRMLAHTLEVLQLIPEIEQTLVVSRDPAALTLARENGAKTLQEDGAPHLNTALRRAAAVARVYSTSGILVLPADLPLLQPSDITEILLRTVKPPVVVVAPDRHRQGTNALYQSPAGLVDFAFGLDSFQKHCERAEKANARLEILELPSIGLDLDLPEDLEILREIRKDIQGVPFIVS
jgi:2-phospho-L-lactate/phosphoenolpyruvate guanylyltransferase